MRRRAILSAARSLLAEVATDQVSLTALALRSGISKANVYRYFESREEVLLQVWVEEVRELTRRLEADLATVPTGDVDGVSDVIVAALEAQPKLSELTSIVSPGERRGRGLRRRRVARRPSARRGQGGARAPRTSRHAA